MDELTPLRQQADVTSKEALVCLEKFSAKYQGVLANLLKIKTQTNETG